MMTLLRSLFGAKVPPQADPRDPFAAEVEQFLRKVPSVKDVKRAPDAFAFDVVTSAGPRRVFLDNAFAESREMSPAQRRAKIALFFAFIGAEEQNESWADARETFVPVLRGATYGMELWLKQPAAGFVRRPFLPHVDILVAMDRPTSMSFVGRGTVDRWKVEERDVFDAAAARVALLAGANIERYDETHGPLWIVTSNDSNESSRLLVPGWLASFRGKVEGNPLAIVPDRGTLMVGGDGRPEMVGWLLEKAEREFAASNRPLSPALYTVNDAGRVVPYARPPGDVLATKVTLAYETLAIYEHGQQRDVLEKVYAKNGPDVFVASYQVLHGPERGPPRSLSVWTQGVRSYLPRTERVMLLSFADQKGAKPKATVEVPFERIENRLTPVPDLHPARFETTGAFPSEEELRLMGGTPLDTSRSRPT